ncbi:ATP-binding protein [Bacteroides sp.]|uniref:ATP-binding protein n=1 Tax=Bacteroides sp. TaxID=29523 RepID=UPI00258C71B8|nr:ATP-binding protein [Bacteroides sp.]
MFFDFTPDPKVLIALTHTPMRPLDALCELIDNAIDSFNAAKFQAVGPVSNPIVSITLPKKRQLDNGTGVLRVQDNGPGMTAESAERAIRAGFSGNNPYDSLGLFGMGFNISTGKLGNRTTLLTARQDEAKYISTVIDLGRINSTKNYQLEVEETVKASGAAFEVGGHGTIIEVTDWWPKGNDNNGFVQRLVRYGGNKIREELGRRYATILRAGEIKILVDGEKCVPFEHCVWADTRYVTRKGKKIPAVMHIDQVLGADKRCSKCTAIISPGVDKCPQCGNTTFRTIQKRVTGWIGIQRFEDKTRFGIDLIRNGRAIRTFEKDAFFKYVDDFGNEELDYPIDSTMNLGRIVGEIHMDFVPVDFLKQDFQRSSAEWQEAMSFLRGNSSLQPSKEGAADNHSPMFQLYQGYRRVKDIGRGDMYMGYYDPKEDKGKRISKDIIEDYYQKFLDHVPGYYDDTEWWKLVEAADQEPAPKYVYCPECSAQNIEGASECVVCGTPLQRKQCINDACKKMIPVTAKDCPFCGSSQVVSVVEPWNCKICGTKNIGTNEICSKCGSPRGMENPLSEGELLKVSDKMDGLSNEDLVIQLANGEKTKPLWVEVYATKGAMVTPLDKHRVPLQIFKVIGKLTMFIDLSHPLFTEMGMSAEQVVASETAMYLYDEWRSLAGNPEHNLSVLTWAILQANWKDELDLTPDTVAREAQDLLDTILQRLKETMAATDSSYYFEELTDTEKKVLTNNLINNGVDLTEIGTLKETGGYLTYVPYSFIMTVFNQNPDDFFGGKVWRTSLVSGGEELLGKENIEEFRNKLIGQYRNYLQDLISYTQNKYTDTITMKRVKLSVEFLQRSMVE